ncbi:MAG: DUF2066 domain-containing protein, partial [Sphingomonadales bacterium]
MLFFLFFLGFCIICLPFYAIAQEERIFSVYGVEVDVTASTAAGARTSAFFAAEKIAFNRLLKKIAELDQLYKLPYIEANQIRSFVRGIDVVEEKGSAVRYLATLDVSFDSRKILELLGQYRIKFSEIGPKPIVLLPILKVGNTFSLWELENIWRKSWESVDLKNKLLDYRLPKGGFDDRLQLPEVIAIRPSQETKNRFLTFAQKYNAEDVLILIAEEIENKNSKKILLNLNYKKALENNDFEEGQFVSFENESHENFYKRVAEIILNRMDLSWKYATLTTFGAFNNLNATLIVNS